MNNVGYCRKFLSILLAFILLINTNIPSFSQKPQTDIQKEIAILRAEIAENIRIISDKDIKRIYRREYNFKSLFDYINRQGFNNNYGEVCDGEICAPYHTFMRGLIGALINFTERDGGILINYTHEIREAVFMGAFASEDIKPLKELLKAGIKEKLPGCDGKSDYKAQDNCQRAMEGMSILSAITENEKDSADTADLIYNTLNKYKNSTYAGLVLMESIAALSFIDTDYSYSLIEKFLTQDTVPSVIGNRTRDALSFYTFRGQYDIWESAIEKDEREGTRYLNRHNEKWQYINTAATEKEGVSTFIFSNQKALNRLMNTDEDYLKTTYRVVYNNILTDIGEFLTQQGERGQKLAQKIVKNFINADDKTRQTIHTPLILGLIQNLKTNEAGLAAMQIQSGFYYDINGGTGKFISQKANINGPNAHKLPTIFRSEESYLKAAKIKRFTAFGDILLAAVALYALAAHMPEIISNLKRLGSLLKFRKSAPVKSVAEVNNFASAVAVRSVKPSLSAVPEIKAVQAASALATVNTATTLSKVRSVLNTQSKVLPDKAGKVVSIEATSAAVNKQVNYANKISKFISDLVLKFKTPFDEVQNSVLKLEALGYQVTGYLAKVPIYGVNKQVIITAGHFTPTMLDTPIHIYNRKGKFLGRAHTMLFNNIVDKDFSTKIDYALLVPDKKLPLKPLNLDFDRSLYEYKEVIKIGYPKNEYKVKTASPAPEVSKILPMENIEYLRYESIGGFSGSPIVAKTAPGKYSVLGTLIATATFDNTETYTVVKNLNWLKDFIKGRPIQANFRFPTFPPSPFIFSNPRYAKIADIPIHISGQIPNKKIDILSGKKSNLQITNTSFQFDKPYLPWKAFDSHESATLFPMGNITKKANPVWGVYDFMGNINKFLMYGTETDIRLMRLFDRIVTENELKGKYKLIDIEYPKFISVIEEGLPRNVWEDITEIKENIKYPSNAILMPYMTTPVKINGAIWVEEDAALNANFKEKSDFANNPITPNEWEEVYALFQDINNNDFIFDNLERSVHLKRNNQGKLIVVFSNFKYSPVLKSNYAGVISIGKKFEYLGLKKGWDSVVKNR